MKLTEAVLALKQRLQDELVLMAAEAQRVFVAGTAATQQFIAYQIVSQYDNEVRLNVIAASDAPYGTANQITIYATLSSRKGKASFTYLNDGGEVGINIDGGAGIDDLVPWTWMAMEEKSRLATTGENDFPYTLGVDKKIAYTITQGAELTLKLSESVTLSLTPAPALSVDRRWFSVDDRYATVSPFVLNAAAGGLVTPVDVGQTIVQNTLAGQTIINVVPNDIAFENVENAYTIKVGQEIQILPTLSKQSVVIGGNPALKPLEFDPKRTYTSTTPAEVAVRTRIVDGLVAGLIKGLQVTGAPVNVRVALSATIYKDIAITVIA